MLWPTRTNEDIALAYPAQAPMKLPQHYYFATTPSLVLNYCSMWSRIQPGTSTNTTNLTGKVFPPKRIGQFSTHLLHVTTLTMGIDKLVVSHSNYVA
jgi:hypothetical protein